MRKAAPSAPKAIAPLQAPSFNPYFAIASVLTFFVPTLVLPYLLDNVFSTPKAVLMQLGVCLMAAVYSLKGQFVFPTGAIVRTKAALEKSF